jgi:hypothetical protein
MCGRTGQGSNLVSCTHPPATPSGQVRFRSGQVRSGQHVPKPAAPNSQLRWVSKMLFSPKHQSMSEQRKLAHCLTDPKRNDVTTHGDIRAMSFRQWLLQQTSCNYSIYTAPSYTQYTARRPIQHLRHCVFETAVASITTFASGTLTRTHHHHHPRSAPRHIVTSHEPVGSL